MPNPENVIIIPKNTEINYANNEDGESFIAKRAIVAIPVGGVTNGGLPVIIPSLDSERIYFIHQPEKKATDSV